MTSKTIIKKPWGFYEILYELNNYKIKKIVINKDHKISLQYHFNRDEYWIVIDGFGISTINNLKENLYKGKSLFIPNKTIHRIEAKTDLEIIEVQIGDCNENDIVRLEDDYNRV